METICPLSDTGEECMGETLCPMDCRSARTFLFEGGPHEEEGIEIKRKEESK